MVTTKISSVCGSSVFTVKYQILSSIDFFGFSSPFSLKFLF